MRRHIGTWRVAWMLALALLHGALATAQPLADYRLDNTGWNGLSSLDELIRFVGAEPEERQVIDVGTLDAGTVLVLVYPTGPVDAEPLRAWVQSGGRLVVLDDFGTGDEVAAAFGLTRVAQPLHAGESLESNPSLAIRLPVGRHELTHEVTSVVTNHASGLRGDGIPVVAWDDDSGLVYDMLLGSGRAVFIADASMVTNLMLAVRDNAVLMRNVLRAQCGGSTACRVVVAAHEVEVGGVVGDGGRLDTRRWRAWIERVVDELAALELREPPLYMASALLAAGLAVLLFTVFPQPSGDTPRREPRPGRSAYELAIDRFTGSARDRNRVLPAVLLRERLWPLLWELVGTPPAAPDAPMATFEAAATRILARGPSGAGPTRRELATALRWLARLPAREALTVDLLAHVSEADFRRMTRILYSTLEHTGRTDVTTRLRSRPS